MSETGTDISSRTIIKSAKRVAFLKLLSMPSPTKLLSLKQKKSLFLKAAHTACNYMGRPTSQCPTDAYGMYKYIGKLFQDESSINKRYIYEKAKALPASSYKIWAQILRAELEDSVKLKACDSIYFRTFTNPQFISTSKALPASLSPQWNEQFVLDVLPGDADITTEIWVEPPRGSSYIIGRVVQDLKYIPCTADSMWLFIEESDEEPCKVQGYLKVKYAYQTEDPKMRLNILFQHLLFCYLSFERHLHKVRPIEVDVLSAMQTIPQGQKVKLYEHAMRKVLPDDAVTFLHQHIMQSGLTAYENVLCCWLVANQCYLKTDEVGLSAVHALLQELTLMGTCPQRNLDPELKATFLTELDTSAEKCCDWLCNLMRDIKTDTGKMHLEHVLQYLVHVDSHYNTECLEKAKTSMRNRTTLQSKVLFDLHMQRGNIKWSKALTGDVIKDLQNILDALKSADEIFLRSEWKTSYTGIVYQKLDKKLTESLGFVMANLAEESTHFYSENIGMLISIYNFLNDLVTYIIADLPQAHERLGLQSCHLWIGPEVFISYMKQITEKHSPFLNSWLGSFDVKPSGTTENGPVLKYVNEILKEWENLTWLDPLPPTLALIQVFGEKCSLLSQSLYDHGKTRSWYCVDDLFKIRLQLCNLLNKMQVVVDSVKVVSNRITPYCENDNTERLRFEIQRLEVDVDNLQDVYETLERKLEKSIRFFIGPGASDQSKALSKLRYYLEETIETIQTMMDVVPRQRMLTVMEAIIRRVMLDKNEVTDRQIHEALQQALFQLL